MIDEEKVGLMTKLAIYEKHEEKRDIPLTRFYEEDYVKLGCIRTILALTFGYFLFVAAYFYMHMEEMIAKINEIDYFGLAKKIFTGYILILLIFFVYAFIVYTVRYNLARRGLMAYNRNLRKLMNLYEGKRPSKRRRRRRKIEEPEKALRVSGNIGGDIPELDDPRMDSPKLAEDQEKGE